MSLGDERAMRFERCLADRNATAAEKIKDRGLIIVSALIGLALFVAFHDFPARTANDVIHANERVEW